MLVLVTDVMCGKVGLGPPQTLSRRDSEVTQEN